MTRLFRSLLRELARLRAVVLRSDRPLPPPGFTAQEAALLIAAGGFLAEMRVLPFTQTLASGLDKVRATLPSSTQRELALHLETLKFVGVPARTATPGVRQVLEFAWSDGMPVTIRYAGANGTTTRRVRIRSVVMARSETLVNALDLDKNEERQFRLDRISHAALLTAGHP